jgi:hypothetical protein
MPIGRPPGRAVGLRQLASDPAPMSHPELLPVNPPAGRGHGVVKRRVGLGSRARHGDGPSRTEAAPPGPGPVPALLHSSPQTSGLKARGA